MTSLEMLLIAAKAAAVLDVLEAAHEVATFDWAPACSENYHCARAAAMHRLRTALLAADTAATRILAEVRASSRNNDPGTSEVS